MDENKFQERITQEAEAGRQAGAESLSLGEVLGGSTDRVRETIGKAGENGGTSRVRSIKKQSGLVSISQRISQLLFSRDIRPAQIPSVSEQRKQLSVTLEKERDQLLKKASRIESRRDFSAAALEEVIRQIRYLQQLLAELMHIAVQKLEQLYRQYVLKGVA